MAVPCYEEQRRQRAGKVCNRACSVLTQSVSVIERMKVNVHAAFQTIVSGQLRNPGSRFLFGYRRLVAGIRDACLRFGLSLLLRQLRLLRLLCLLCLLLIGLLQSG